MGARSLLKRIICTLLLVLLGFGISVNASAADRYKWIWSTDGVTLSYDTQSFQYDSYRKTVDVWVLWQYTEDGARKEISDNRADGYMKDAKWDNYSYSIIHYVISKNSFKRLGSYSYDWSNKLLEAYNNKNPEWQDVVPDTMIEAIRDTFIDFLKVKP